MRRAAARCATVRHRDVDGAGYLPWMPIGPSLRLEIRDSILILLAIGTFGIAFGVLAVDAGFSAGVNLPQNQTDPLPKAWLAVGSVHTA